MATSNPTKTKALCVATRCTSVAQFVATFHRFCDDSSFFVATLSSRPVGLETAFSIQLEDKTPVLRGMCSVIESWTTADNRYGRPGVRLAVRRLTNESVPVFKQLQAARATATVPPPMGTASPSEELVPTTIPPPTVAIPALPPVPRALATPPPLPTVRTTKPTTSPIPRVIVPLSGGARIPRPRSALPTATPAMATPVVTIAVSIPDPTPPPAPPPAPAAIPEPIAARDDATTPVPTETRTPGSSFVLPANPLMNLTDQSLEGFVDCALYEETANFFRAPSDESALVDLGDVVEPPPPLLAPRPALSQTNDEMRASQPIMVSPDPDPEPPLIPRYEPVSYEPPEAYDPPTMPANPLQHAMEPPPPPSFEPPPHAPLPPQPPMWTPPARAAVARDSTAALLALSSPRRRWMVIAGAAVGTLVLVVILLVVMRGGSTSEATPAKPSTVAKLAIVPGDAGAAIAKPPSPAAPPDAALVVAIAKPDAAAPPATAESDEAAATADGNAPPIVGSGPCRLTVTSTPAGSIIKLDDQVVGPSPITIDGPCANRRIEASHARYAPSTRAVALAADKPTTVDLMLSRPTHTLTVVTVPAGANVSIAGRSAGTTPTSLKIMGFSGVSITVDKRGYKPVVTKIYSKIDPDRLTVKLQPTITLRPPR